MTNEMTIISSQRFRDDEIIEQKIEELKENGTTKVTAPVIRSYMKDDNGNDLYILVDKHHTISAAIALGIEIEFEEVDDDISYYQDIEDQNGEAICEAHWMDSNWYYIDTDEENAQGVDVW